MSYIRSQVRYGEKIIYQTSVSWLTGIKSIILFLAIFYIKGITRIFTTEIAITDQRLIGKSGWLSPVIINMQHKEIERVYVRYGLFGKLFDVGNLTVVSVHGKKITFKGISFPVLLEYAINDAIEIATFGKKLEDIYSPEPF